MARTHPRLRRTDRDDQLLLAVGIARQLCFSQLRRLFFPGVTPQTAHHRLQQLKGFGRSPAHPPLLRSAPFYDADGVRQQAYLLTASGQEFVQSKLQWVRFPTVQKLEPESLKHNIGLAEVLVDLMLKLKPEGRAYPQFSRMPFRWRVHVPIPLGYRSEEGQARLLIPDALLEIPATKKRYLIEYETGTQTLIPLSKGKRGATMNKLLRYGRLLHDERIGEKRTAYQAHFEDDLEGRLVFLTPSKARVERIEAVKGRLRQLFQLPLGFTSYSFEPEAFVERTAALIAPHVQAATPAKDPRKLATDERAIAHVFMRDALRVIKRARNVIRAVNEETGGKREVPEYPDNAEEMMAIVKHRGGER
jgi:hypothetical protein